MQYITTEKLEFFFYKKNVAPVLDSKNHKNVLQEE